MPFLLCLDENSIFYLDLMGFFFLTGAKREHGDILYRPMILGADVTVCKQTLVELAGWGINIVQNSMFYVCLSIWAM